MNRTTPRILLVCGTRPEAIKLAPVVLECRRRADLETLVCLTGQHRELLRQVTDYFGIAADVHLDVMAADRSLARLTANCLTAIDGVLGDLRPDCVVVQGDTTSAMAAALAAFYARIPCVHVEAGLRTGDLGSPFPEELNRRVAGLVATVHCAPTRRAADNLRAEGVPAERIHVTGNPVIDALCWTIARERAAAPTWQDRYPLPDDRPVVLVTAHRRESFGAGLERIGRAVALLAGRFADVAFVFPVHPNPEVRATVTRLLGARTNVHLLEPLSYPAFTWMMDRCRLILTDSGGVQEEAPTLRKPVLVLRDVTERTEAVAAGAARLVGTRVDDIVAAATELLTDPAAYRGMQIEANPYGDGHAAPRIVDLIAATAAARPVARPAGQLDAPEPAGSN